MQETVRSAKNGQHFSKTPEKSWRKRTYCFGKEQFA